MGLYISNSIIYISNFSLTLKYIKCHKNFSICQLFISNGKYFRQLKSKFCFITKIQVFVAYENSLR